MTEIRLELRENSNAEAELWVNLEDVFFWLGALPRLAGNRIEPQAATEIRQMLYDAVVTPAEQN